MVLLVVTLVVLVTCLEVVDCRTLWALCCIMYKFIRLSRVQYIFFVNFYNDNLIYSFYSSA